MQQKIFSTETHRNHFLFSDYYLKDILPKLESWKKGEGAAEANEKLRKLYLKVREGLAASNEAQLEKDWVQPILRILEHAFEVHRV